MIVSIVTIQGHHKDANGVDLTADIGQRVTLSGGRTTTASPAWDFTEIPADSYIVTAAFIADYTISYSSCINCTSHSSYTNGNSLTVNLPTTGNYADIYCEVI